MEEYKLALREFNDDEIDKVILKNIKGWGGTLDVLTDKELRNLRAIERDIQEVFLKEKIAKELSIKNDVTIKGIASRTGLARQTIYNNNLYKQYIEKRASKFDKIDISKKEKNKDDKAAELEEELKLLHRRDAQIEELKIIVENLKQTIKEKDIRIIELSKKLNQEFADIRA